ncbi:hypothetical protein C4546_01445 [Candidatus Parcubacteria bacterium]|nr:MAG: hypothetical protein C4546_01445 [Candidatus Parcubacteria bacterium]
MKPKIRRAKKPKKIFKGAALLESVIAIGVIMTGVVGSLVLINTTIKLGRTNQDRIIAQNLAREGIELAYGLRNSATLVHTEDSTVSWDSYLYKFTLKSGSYDTLYDLGTGNYDAGTCVTIAGGDAILDMCDIQVLLLHLYEGGPLPSMCNTIPNGGSNPSPDANGCDFNNDGVTGILDVTFMISSFYKESYQFSAGYPVLSTKFQPNAQLVFYDVRDGETINLSQMWDDARSRIQVNNGAYVQNVTEAGNTPTKFYRTVIMQEVCRGTQSGSEEAVLVPTDSVLNCYDYVKAQGWSDADAGTIKKVGVLANSEVRWPSPTSGTKVLYQEYIYDWLNF